MHDGAGEVRWPPRVKKHPIRRLYEADARGIVDEELIDDVGTALYARVEAILSVDEARRNRRVRCPVCEREGRESWIARLHGRDEPLVCARCGWETTWLAYMKTFKRRQLNIGGAGPAFRAFVTAWRSARTPQQKMVAIDRVIHEWHYSIREQPDVPSRAAAVNLIDGKLTDVLAFLDALTYGDGSTTGLAETRAVWRRKATEMPWNALPPEEGDEVSTC